MSIGWQIEGGGTGRTMLVTRCLQFSLISLLLLVIPAGTGALWIKSILSGRQPIEWQTFTPDALARHVGNGRTVLVFASPNYHTQSAVAAMAFNDQRLRRAFHDGHFVALLLQYDDWEGASIRSLFREVGHTKQPFVVVYSSEKPPAAVVCSADTPSTRLPPYSADGIVAELPRSSVPSYGVAFSVSAFLVAITIWRLRPARWHP